MEWHFEQMPDFIAGLPCGNDGLLGLRASSQTLKRRPVDVLNEAFEQAAVGADDALWTLSLPYDVRFRVGYDKNLLGAVLSIFLRTVFSYQRLRARRLGVKRPLTGSITLCQRYGSILRWEPRR